MCTVCLLKMLIHEQTQIYIKIYHMFFRYTHCLLTILPTDTQIQISIKIRREVLRLPLLEERSCFLPGPVYQSMAGSDSVPASTSRQPLHGVVVSRVSRQVWQLAVLTCGGNEHLHRVANSVRWTATGDDQSWILLKISLSIIRLKFSPSEAVAEAVLHLTNPVIRINNIKTGNTKYRPYQILLWTSPRIAMFNISQCRTETDTSRGR